MKKEELVKFYYKYRIYIFPTVVVLSSLFLIIFAIYPQTIKLISNQKTQEDLLNKSKFLNSKVQALESYNPDDLQRKVGYVLNAYPSNKDFTNVIGLVQQLVTLSGFNIVSISLGSGNSSSGNTGYQVKLELTGTKAQFPSLLINLEKSPRLMRIVSFDGSTNSNKQSIDLSIAVTVLYAPVPANGGNVDSPLPQLSTKDNEILATLASSPGISATTIISSPIGKADPFE